MSQSNLDALDRIRENRLLRMISAELPRADASRNSHQEADAELADVGLREQLLAVTTDTVADEVVSGLYTDPYEIGWVAVVASLSDLAAVGASPVGIVSSLCLAKSWSAQQQRALLAGMASALRRHGTGTLGGDTNFGAQASVTVTALGLVPRDRVLRRVGAKPGDLVFVSGPCGAGSQLALERLWLRSESPTPYRPLARLALGRSIAECASSCIDTSDGLVAALDQLQRCNGLSFTCGDLSAAVKPETREALRGASLPAIAALCGIHGDFELCFTLPPDSVAVMRSLAHECGLEPVQLGYVDEGPPPPGLRVDSGMLDTPRIRDAWDTAKSLQEYVGIIIASVRESLEAGNGPTTNREPTLSGVPS